MFEKTQLFRIMHARNARDQSLDILRGVGITAVIFYHGWMLAVDGEGVTRFNLDTSDFYSAVVGFLAPLRMPTMVFLAGWLANIGLEKYSRLKFIASKAERLLYPLILWSVFYAVLKSNPLTGSRPGEFLESVLLPTNHLWYLQYMCLYFVLLTLLKDWKITLIIVAFAAMAVFTWLEFRTTDRFLYLLIFFFAGALAPKNAIRLVRDRTLLVKGLIILATFVIVFVSLSDPHSKYDIRTIPVSVIGLIGLYAVAAVIAAHSAVIGGFLRYAGNISLELYIFHWLFVKAGVLLFARLLAIQNGDAVSFLAFLFSLGGSIVATEAVYLIGAAFLFKSPVNIPVAARPASENSGN